MANSKKIWILHVFLLFIIAFSVIAEENITEEEIPAEIDVLDEDVVDELIIEEKIPVEENITEEVLEEPVEEVIVEELEVPEPVIHEEPGTQETQEPDALPDAKAIKKDKIKTHNKLGEKLKQRLENKLEDLPAAIESDEEPKRLLVIAKNKNKAESLGVDSVGKFAAIETEDVDEILSLAEDEDIELIIEEPILGVSNADVIDIINSEDVNLLTVGGTPLDGAGSAVCLIDTGVNYNHQDLTGFIVNGPDYVNDDSDSMDDNGHGTHIAGTIHEIAPNAQIVSVKVCNSAGGCGGFDMIQGAQWCIENKDTYNIKSISISIGDYAEWNEGNCPTWMDDTLEWAYDEGIFSAAASGNEGFTNGMNYPACSPYTTSVGATTKADGIGVSSNRGPELDLMAPGAMIISADYADTSGYIMKSGTSMSVPSVSASATILKRYYELNSITKTPDELKQLMRDTAFDIIGYKRLDLKAAVDQDGLYDGNEPPISCDELPDIISYWSFDSGVSDELGINDGSTSGPVVTAGTNGNALYFDGTDDYVQISDNPTLDLASELTLQAWVNPSDYANWGMGIIDKSSFDGAGGNFRLSMNYIENRATFRIKLDGFVNDLAASRELTSTDAIPLNEWTHIAATYNGSEMKIYINGVLDTTKAVEGTLVTDLHNIRIGQYLGPNRFFKGKIDEVAVFSRALTPTEIQTVYDNGAAGKKICAPGDGGILSEISENGILDEDLKGTITDMIINSADAEEDAKLIVVAKDSASAEGLSNETAGKYALADFDNIYEILDIANNPDVEMIMEEPVLGVSNADVIDIINSEDVNPLTVGGISLTGADSAVCLIDTGIDYNHEDLTGSIILGPDFVNDDSDPMDDNGHGTHIAGTILSIAPETKVIAVKVCNSGGGCGGFDMIQGTQWCADHKDDYNITALSISIGDYGEHTSATCPTWMDSQLQSADDDNIFISAASGNEGYTNGMNYPACSPYTTSVGATTKADGIGVSSNRGPELDLMAPGAMIISTCLGGGTCMKSGTSMATPSVSASAAVLKQYYGLAGVPKTNAEIEQLMKDTAHDIMGYKRVDLKAAVDEDELYDNTVWDVINNHPKLDGDLKAKLVSKVDEDGNPLPNSSEVKRLLFVAVDKPAAENLSAEYVEDVAAKVMELNDVFSILDLADISDVEWVLEDPVLTTNARDASEIINASYVTGIFPFSDGTAYMFDGGGSGVCILDTGIRADQLEFARGINMEPIVVQGPDFVNDDSDPADDNGHGTHVAGIVTTITPFSHLVVVKVCDEDGNCNGFDVMKGVEWCVDNQGNYTPNVAINPSHKIRAMVLSMGDDSEHSDCPFWMDGVLGSAYDANIFISAGSGNDGYDSGINYPACSPHTISVGSTDKSDSISTFTNRHSNLDLLAPGEDIWAASKDTLGGLVLKSGTSTSAPFVAASAVILMSLYDENSISKTPNDIKALFQDTGIDISGYKRIDLLAALEETGLAERVDMPCELMPPGWPLPDHCGGGMPGGALPDADGDGFDISIDCNDEDPLIHPDAEEVCDGIDNNCRFGIDEDLETSIYYLDNDGDSYGDADSTEESCAASENYVVDNTDCNDNDAAIHPGVEEIEDDGIDNNCNGEIDEVIEAPAAPAPQPSSSGGGGGGSSRKKEIIIIEPEVCFEDWICAPWSECDGKGTKTRICEDWNACGTTDFKPSTSEECTEADYPMLHIVEQSESVKEFVDSEESEESTNLGIGTASSFMSKINPINIFKTLIDLIKNIFS